jgi:RNA polymerase sigma-70 factor (ECF subfamily)
MQEQSNSIENKALIQVIAGCKRGDSDSFSRLVDMFSKRCYGYFYRLCGSRELSDELLSQLFVKLVEKIGSYKDGSFESWIFRVASNIFQDYLREKQRQKKLFEGHKSQLQERSKALAIGDDERIDELQAQLAKLDPETRELLVLRFYSEMSFKEIAEMRSEPIGTTLSKVHRGLNKLREMMGIVYE